jgi:hypothetical protein
VASPLTRIVFINGFVPWTEDITFKDAVTDYSKYLSDYTKELLESESRLDSEVDVFFGRLNTGIAQLDQNQWVNMFKSFGSQAVDRGNDGSHPGTKSHQLYADLIIDYLERHR